MNFWDEALPYARQVHAAMPEMFVSFVLAQCDVVDLGQDATQGEAPTPTILVKGGQDTKLLALDRVARSPWLRQLQLRRRHGPSTSLDMGASQRPDSRGAVHGSSLPRPCVRPTRSPGTCDAQGECVTRRHGRGQKSRSDALYPRTFAPQCLSNQAESTALSGLYCHPGSRAIPEAERP